MSRSFRQLCGQRLSDLGARLGARLFTLMLIALGLAALYQASSLSFGSIRQPGSGFYPTLVCIALIAFAGFALRDPPAMAAEDQASPAGGQARLWLFVGVVAAYVWALPSVGFVLTTIALLLFLLQGVGQVSWRGSIITAVVGSVGCYEFFTRLGLPLPRGLLPF